jgi:hypothetical protein
LVLILKGFKPLGKNLRNLPKLIFVKVYTTLILDHHACI